MKVTIHHVVAGPSYTNSNSGHDIQASTLSRQQLRDSRLWFLDAQEHTRGATTGIALAPRQDGPFWVEAMAWNDDQPQRVALRKDTRPGFSRTHAILWPSKEAADRLRDQVPFVDPITLDPRLRTTPPVMRLEDNPCPHCSGSGTAPEQHA